MGTKPRNTLTLIRIPLLESYCSVLCKYTADSRNPELYVPECIQAQMNKALACMYAYTHPDHHRVTLSGNE